MFRHSKIITGMIRGEREESPLHFILVIVVHYQIMATRGIKWTESVKSSSRPNCACGYTGLAGHPLDGHFQFHVRARTTRVSYFFS